MDKELEADTTLESSFSKRLEAGTPTPMTAEDWEDIRNEIKRRAQQR